MSTTAQTTTTTTTTTQNGASTMEQTERLALAIDANVPVLLMGAPGTAKTSMIEALAAERGAYLEVVIASAQDPTTILGIPMPTEDRKYTEPTMPGWARRINAAAAEGRPTILFLDELTTVPPSVAGPLLGIVQSKRADGWTLPAETRIIAAANPPDLAVGGWAIEPAMANRWAHILWEPPVQAWIEWAKAQPSPTLQLVAEYIATNPSDLLAVPQDIRKRSAAWPSPRAWTNAAKLIDQGGGAFALAAMTVGDAAAGTFAAWAAKRDVPSPEELRAGTRPLPTRQDALVTALRALVDTADDDNLDRTQELLMSAVQIDGPAAAIAIHALASMGHVAGIAALIAAVEATGIDFATVGA